MTAIYAVGCRQGNFFPGPKAVPSGKRPAPDPPWHTRISPGDLRAPHPRLVLLGASVCSVKSSIFQIFVFNIFTPQYILFWFRFKEKVVNLRCKPQSNLAIDSNPWKNKSLPSTGRPPGRHPMAAAGGGVRGPRGRGGSRVRLRPRGLRPHPRGPAQGPGLCRAGVISVELWAPPPSGSGGARRRRTPGHRVRGIHSARAALCKKVCFRLISNPLFFSEDPFVASALALGLGSPAELLIQIC